MRPGRRLGTPTTSGDYLEGATGADEVEGPLSWRDYEFQVRIPEGRVSDWVTFTYPFDDDRRKQLQREWRKHGEEVLASRKPIEAVELLRKAYVFADRLFGL